MMLRNARPLLLVCLAACLAGGCAPTPCSIIESSPNRWTCNLTVVEPLEPGDIVYKDGEQFVRLPVPRPGGFVAEERPSSVPNVLDTDAWEFGLEAGLAGIPNIGSIEAPKVDLQNSGASKLTMNFTDTTVSTLTTTDASGSIDSLEAMRETATRLLNNFGPALDGDIAEQTGSGQVLLVMQTLDARVSYQLQSSSSFGADIGATIEGVAASIEGVRANTRSRALEMEQPQTIAYRALPLRVKPPSTLQSGEPRLELPSNASPRKGESVEGRRPL